MQMMNTTNIIKMIENYQNYREVRMTNAAWLARSEYNDSNGVTLALEEIID